MFAHTKKDTAIPPHKKEAHFSQEDDDDTSMWIRPKTVFNAFVWNSEGTSTTNASDAKKSVMAAELKSHSPFSIYILVPENVTSLN